MNLYIPVEIKSREFEAKVFLACLAAKRGYSCLVGRREDMKHILRDLPRGIIIEKGLEPPGKAKMINKYLSYGHIPIALDEEGMFLDKDKYAETRIMEDGFKKVKLYFAWGNYHKKILTNSYPKAENKIKVVGNARIDLLDKKLRSSYSKEVNKLNSKYGKVILINSSFTLASPANGEKMISRFKDSGFYDNEELKEWWERKIEDTINIRQQFLDAIVDISNLFDEYSVVIRPHPSEDRSYWIKNTSDINNVEVIHKGSVIPWLLHADVMIHSSCTTAIESILLDKISIAYDPLDIQEYETDLPRKVSIRVEDKKDLLEKINWIIGLKTKDKAKYQQITNEFKKELKEFIPIDNEKFYSELMLDEIDKVSQVNEMKNSFGGKSLIKLSLKNILRKIYYRHIKRKSDYRKITEYSLHKFPDTKLKEVRNIVGKYDCTGVDFNDIKTNKFYNNIFYIRSNE